MSAARYPSLHLAAAFLLAISASPSPARAGGSAECADQAERASDLRSQGHLLAAAKLYEACAVDACPGVVREDCRAALHALREATPRLTLRVRDAAGLDVTGARVTLDGLPVTPEDAARGLAVDPGPHTIHVSTKGSRDLDRELLVAASDRLRAVELTLDALPGPRADVAAPPAPPSGVRKNRVPAVITGAFGVASLGVFGVLGTWSYLDYQHLKSTCGGACSADQVAPAQRRAAVGDAFLAAGLVTLVTATVLWFAAPGSRPAPPAASLVAR